jgi:CheY-like chemotaxis protein
LTNAGRLRLIKGTANRECNAGGGKGVSVRKPKIVVIDDSEVVLEVTQGALEGAGFDVVTHDRPAGCVALILHEKPDLVLMDVNMPGLGGDTIVSVLAKAHPTSETVVLLHSSLSAEVLRTKATVAGAHGFIQKSGDLFGLVREINRWLKRAGAPGAMSSGKMRAAAPVNVDDARPSGARVVATSAASSRESLGAVPIARRSSGTLRVDAPTVLLVDDDMGILSGYRRQLQSEDVSIEFALSGGQAVRRMLSEKPPDVVVCDMVLPDISGVEVYQRAVAVEPSYRQRFAVATSSSTTTSIASFLSSFSGPVLHKPVDPVKLMRAVRACLDVARPFQKSGSRV